MKHGDELQAVRMVYCEEGHEHPHAYERGQVRWIAHILLAHIDEQAKEIEQANKLATHWSAECGKVRFENARLRDMFAQFIADVELFKAAGTPLPPQFVNEARSALVQQKGDVTRETGISNRSQ